MPALVYAKVKKKPCSSFVINKSSGDAFLIATAKKYGLTVITEEAANSQRRYRSPVRRWVSDV